MNIKILAGLLLLNVLVWSFVLFSGDSEGDTGKLFPELETKKVEAFSVRTKKGLTIVRRADVATVDESVLYDEGELGFWELENPSGAPASAEFVATVLQELAKLEFIKKEKVSEDTLKQLGLSPPEVELYYSFVQDNEAKFVRLDLGKRSPISGHFFARKLQRPGTVYTVGDELSEILTVDPVYYREHYPFRVNLSEFDGIEVTNQYGRWYMTVQDGKWMVTLSVGSFPVDDATIAEVVNRLSRLKVKRFVDEFDGGLEQFGLTSPSVTVRFAKALVTDELYLGRDIDETTFYAKINTAPWIYELESPWPSKLNGSPSNLLSRQPYQNINAEDIDVFMVSRSTEKLGETRVWTKAGKLWKSFYEEEPASNILQRIKKDLAEGELEPKKGSRPARESEVVPLAALLGQVRFMDYDFEAKEKLLKAPNVWEITIRENGRWWGLSATSILVEGDSAEITAEAPVYGVAILYGGQLTTPVVLSAFDASVVAKFVSDNLK